MNQTVLAPPKADRPDAPRIYFIRHGETDWNREGRLQGQKDIPLNDLGRRQAREVALHLRGLTGTRLETLPWLLSPMQRVRETSAIVRHALGLPAEGGLVEPLLMELGFGAWEGLTWKEVRKTDPAGAARRGADKWGCVPPGGESYLMLRDRVRPVIAGLGPETVIVAHGGVARAFLAELAGLGETEAAVTDIWQGRILVLEKGGAYWTP